MEISRRNFITSTFASSIAMIAPNTTIAQSAKPKVVIIGGGVGGVMSARYLTEYQDLSITLIEPNKSYHAPFMSNWTLANFNTPNELTHSYEALSALDNLQFIQDYADGIDIQNKEISLRSGQKLTYDFLIISPGISYQIEAIENYQMLTEYGAVSAYANGAEVAILRDQIHNMKQGGVLLITAPAYPYRCPPAPYERATMAAHWFKNHNPTAKILIIDGKDSFAMQGLFEATWGQEYDGMIEHVPLDFTGPVIGINKDRLGVITEYDSFDADVLSYIPKQQAGIIAQQAELTDRQGWCPVDLNTFQSTLAPDVYIIGDSAMVSPMPKSAAAAISQSKRAAKSIIEKIGIHNNLDAPLTNICWSRVGTDDAIRTSADYTYSASTLTTTHPFTSDVEENTQQRLKARIDAESWYQETTETLFG